MKLLSRESGNKWMDSNNKIGMNREKGVRLRLMSAILVITSVMTGCGGSKSTYAETAAGAPAAVAEEIAYEDSMAYDTAAYDDGVILNNSAKSASYDYGEAEAAAEEPVSEEGYVQEDAGQGAVAPETSRKLIKTVNILAETEDFDTLVPGETISAPVFPL